MSHTDPEIMALRALGEPAGTAHDAEHAESCPQCRAELARLTDVVRLAQHGDPGEMILEAPAPQVWNRIAAAVGVSAALNGSAPAASPTLNGAARFAELSAGPEKTTADRAEPPATSAERSAGRAERSAGRVERSAGRADSRRRALGFWPRGRLAGTLAGLAAGLIIGIGGAAGVSQLAKTPPAHVVAQIELSPLPQFPQWQGTTGTAVMRATTGQQQIVISLQAPARPGFYEAWLLAQDGVSMISLGDLSANHTGTFTVPPGVDLRNYSRIDISLQPFDGSTQHSKTSVVRGSLPATALGQGAPAGA